MKPFRPQVNCGLHMNINPQEFIGAYYLKSVKLDNNLSSLCIRGLTLSNQHVYLTFPFPSNFVFVGIVRISAYLTLIKTDA